MKAHYGYSDGSGDYFLTVDTDLCDGCGECVNACPQGVFEVVDDDYDEPKAMVKQELRRILGHVCPGFAACVARHGTSCHASCRPAALDHSW